MKLSKQEYRYRYKLFYERHCRKSTQQRVDYYVEYHNITYKDLYYRETLPDIFMMYPTNVAIMRTSKALKKLGISMKDAQHNFRNLSDILSDIADKWNKLGDVNDC